MLPASGLLSVRQMLHAALRVTHVQNGRIVSAQQAIRETQAIHTVSAREFCNEERDTLIVDPRTATARIQAAMTMRKIAEMKGSAACNVPMFTIQHHI